MSMLGLQTEIGQIKALAWSPSPAHRHLVATGLSTGKTLLLNLSPSTLSLPVAGPPPSAPVIAALTVKHTRAVTSISFSPHDANYLATGLERHRSDSSLLIWDIHDAVAASRLPPDGDVHYTRPELRLPTTTPLTKTSSASEPRPIQAYCASEQVNSIAFIPTAPYSLLASAGNKAIRLYDLRAPSNTLKEPNSAGSLAQWSTRTVMSLCPNPSSALFASYESNQGGGNSTVRLWDTRYPGQEVVGWEVRGGVVGMSWVDSMRLGVGSKEGGVGVWDIVRCKPDQSGASEWVTLGGMRQSKCPILHSLHFTF